MNVLPVIVRELRAESRSPFTYWLRVLGAGAVVMTAAYFVLTYHFRADDGGLLFTYLHSALQLAIWVLVPILTADCLSRERREGTLGLLFLTPLKALDIVVAKSLTHGLRAITLLLAVLPVIALPLLMGGVSWRQALASLFLNGCALCLALAAGLLASALSKSWTRSLIIAFGLALLFVWLFCCQLGWVLINHQVSGFPSYRYQIPSYAGVGLRLATGSDPEFLATYYYRARFGAASSMPATPPANMMFQRVLVSAIVSFLFSVVELIAATVIAAQITKRNWQQRPPHPLAIWLKEKLCTPVVMLDVLRFWMKRKLDRNPIGWLEQRTWSGRLVIWGWFAVMISVYSLLLTNPNFLTRSFNGIHEFMAWVLLLSMSVNTSTSFRRERETGVLELLLVTPLNERQIISGRLRGIWEQFFPSVALLLGGWTYLATVLDRTHTVGFPFAAIAFSLTSFIAVPVIGIYYSLVFRNFLTSLVTTVLIALVLPSILGNVSGLAVQIFFSDTAVGPFLKELIGIAFHPCVIQLGIAGWRWRCLHERLINRRFATETT